MFAGIAGSSTAKATVLGGEGSDTLGSTGQYAYNSLTGGAGADSIYQFSSDADNATILGGDGNDTIDFVGGSTSSRIKGEAGDDTITIDGAVLSSTITGGTGKDSIDFTGGNVTSSKIVGGAGNDTFSFGSSATNSGSTFYFGNGDGDDKIYFAASFTSASSKIIAVDSVWVLPAPSTSLVHLLLPLPRSPLTPQR